MTEIIHYPGHELLLKDIVRAENCYLYDSQGKRYVDLESGVWCTSIGHNNPNVLRVIAEQAGRVGHTGFVYSSPVVSEAAREVMSLLGLEGGHCVFLCSGSEAVEYGVRVAQTVAERPLLMTMTDSYFGAYGSASQKQEDEWFCFDWTKCADCPDSEECGEDCEHWAAIPFDRISAFLFEPGSSSGFVRFPPVKLIQKIAAAVKEGDGLFQVNEVTTGVGRTGRWFGYQHYGITPDIVSMGKGIGNGYPVSVAAFGPGVIDRLGGEPLKYAQSHQNDPLGAAVVREVIRVLTEERLIERSGEIAAILRSGLDGIKTRTGRIKEIRSRGLLLALDLEEDRDSSYPTRVHRELVQRGFLLALRPASATFRIDPALTIESSDIENFLTTLEDVLNEV